MNKERKNKAVIRTKALGLRYSESEMIYDLLRELSATKMRGQNAYRTVPLVKSGLHSTKVSAFFNLIKVILIPGKGQWKDSPWCNLRQSLMLFLPGNFSHHSNVLSKSPYVPRVQVTRCLRE